MEQVIKRRLSYIDVSKVLAMFLVTWAHCAQQLSGNLFPVLLISKDSFISFNMAIFMIASGYVMNISKMRGTLLVEFTCSKIIRLLVPMVTWLLIWSLIIYPKHLDYWFAYWYLSSLFICLLTIKILTRFFSSDWAICITSIICLSLIPLHSFERICYMIPFLWVGYLLKFIINRLKIKIALLLTALYLILYFFWDVHFSIYLSPFHIVDIDVNLLFSAVYRFTIGAIGGLAIISWIYIGVDRYRLKWMCYFARGGEYTLVFYTMSFVLNAILAKVMWHFGFYLTTPGILDIVSFILSAFMMALMFYFQKTLEHNKIFCILLGIVYRK